jgi:hypothetical protein
MLFPFFFVQFPSIPPPSCQSRLDIGCLCERKLSKPVASLIIKVLQCLAMVVALRRKSGKTRRKVKKRHCDGSVEIDRANGVYDASATAEHSSSATMQMWPSEEKPPVAMAVQPDQ